MGVYLVVVSEEVLVTYDTGVSVRQCEMFESTGDSAADQLLRYGTAKTTHTIVLLNHHNQTGFFCGAQDGVSINWLNCMH